MLSYKPLSKFLRKCPAPAATACNLGPNTTDLVLICTADNFGSIDCFEDRPKLGQPLLSKAQISTLC